MRQRAARGASAAALLVAVITTLFILSCGKDSPTSPSGPPSNSGLSITSITPGAGTSLGGTTITIAGSGFVAGATVTIGGAPATNVALVSDAAITATTPQHASGLVDIVVTAGSKTGTLRGGYTYAAPAKTDNQPPTISSITAKGSGRSEPGGFADLDERLNVVATVSDPETAVSDLKFEWSSEVGTINGDGPNVTWTAPHDAQTPRDYGLTLTVVETYQTTDTNGLPVKGENRTTKTVTVSLHNSRQEVGDMAVQFLNDFSNSAVSKSTVLRNFTDACRGTADEGFDVDKNRSLWHIDSSSVGRADVTISFNTTCPFRDRGGVDACAQVNAEWHSTCQRTGQRSNTRGVDQVTAIFQGNRWWLCGSDYDVKQSDGPTDQQCAGRALAGPPSKLAGPGVNTGTR